jgi:tetratricopeptide (TPR) repeat protein
LGNWIEADEELERITPHMRAHPDVLCVRWLVYAKAKRWEAAADIAQVLCKMVPDEPFGWIHLAYALHELKRTQEAWNVLLSIADKFPNQYLIRYNLACYAAQCGRLNEAKQWLKQAIEMGDSTEVKQLALDDPDLEPLRNEIGEL